MVKKERRVYLSEKPLEETLEVYFRELEACGFLQPLAGEWVELENAAGRVTAAPVWARISAPHYHACAMDGYAVAADKTQQASEARPLRLKLGELAIEVDTGDKLPAGCDAVIPVEQTQLIEQGGERLVEIMAAVSPWQNVRPRGEDVVESELVLPENRLLGPAELGAAAACGHSRILVRRRPRAALLPTGDELVPIGTEPQPGQVIEFNSLTLAAQLQQWGVRAQRLPILPDDQERIRRAVEEALAENDLVLILSGSSAGRDDLSASVVERLGRVVAHGLAIRPGHPAVLGLAQGRPVIGIPGYPVSALVVLDLVVKPLVYRLQGLPPPERRRLSARLARKLYSTFGKEEYVRVGMGRVGKEIVASALARGAGVVTSLVRADGLLRVPAACEGFSAGQQVEIELLRPAEEIERTIMCIGSHDPALDVLSSMLARKPSNPRLVSIHVGSSAGLQALERGQAHLAGSHLLDPSSGEYNLPAVRERLKRPVALLNFAGRIQGLMVPRGNPKNIRSLTDLVRPDVSFINRQLGAGTRVLLDYHLNRLGIDPEKIRGYQRQATTHLAVAVAVASGSADCGLGIWSAARALGLDFIELFSERYDLVIALEYYQSLLMAPLIELIRSTEFREQLQRLGGYVTEDTGRELAIYRP